MDMDLIIQMAAGLVGGNAAGAALKNLSLGTAGNSIVGAVGGGLGGLLMGLLGLYPAAAGAASGMEMGAIIQSVVVGGAGGVVLTAILGFVKRAMVR